MTRSPIVLSRLALPVLPVSLGLLLLATVAGCQEESPVTSTAIQSAVNQESQPDPISSLERATDFLQRLDEFEPSQVDGQIIYHLNRWAVAIETDPDWQPDPLIDDLPSELKTHSGLTEVRNSKFQLSDVAALKEALWMRQVSNRVASNPQPNLVIWPTEDVRQAPTNERLLREANGLFDWTIRNVQLDELHPEPSGPAAGATGEADRAYVSPPRQGVPGPGYMAQPWQVMLYGHGDAWQRARVFIQLARQQGIDVVMLGMPKSPGSKRVQPWLPAVLLDGELYLFDAELGLPVPGPGGRGIATLADVRANPELLKALAVGAGLPYRVSARELDEVVPLIDASPESLSRRMLALEERLTGKNQLVLSVKPAELAPRLRERGDVQRVALWTLPLEADQFRTTVLRLLATDENFHAFYMRQFGLFEGLHPLVQGRQRYFRGPEESESRRADAIGLYMDCRIPDEEIRQIATNRAAQQRMGMDPSNVKPELYQRQIQAAQIIAMQAKVNATYWIGFVHYTAGSYKVAADWFQRSAEANDGQGPWSAAANYNLARSYESLGRWSEARRIYLQVESPQRHGNLLRARLIAQQHPGS